MRLVIPAVGTDVGTSVDSVLTNCCPINRGHFETEITIFVTGTTLSNPERA